MLSSVLAFESCRKERFTGVCKNEVPDCEITAPLDSLFSSMFGPGEPGAAVVVMRNGTIVYDRAFGVADYKRGMLVTDTTMMNICSLTKSFTVASILKLQKDGRLSVDDPLIKYFPDFNEDVFGKVTLHHVMTHTSGLPDGRPCNSDEWDSYRKITKTVFGNIDDYLLYANDETLVRFYRNVDSFVNEPGTKYAYQEPPFILLGFVIEKASGMPFEEYVAKNFFEPFGLNMACFYEPADKTRSPAHAYSPADATDDESTLSPDGRWAEFDYGESPFFYSHPDHGIMMTAEDAVRWQHALYTGLVLPMDAVDMASAAMVEVPADGVSYGYGTFVCTRQGFPEHPFHMSNNGGFSVVEAAFPDECLYYVLLSNRPDWRRLDTKYKIDDILRSKGWI